MRPLLPPYPVDLFLAVFRPVAFELRPDILNPLRVGSVDFLGLLRILDGEPGEELRIVAVHPVYGLIELLEVVLSAPLTAHETAAEMDVIDVRFDMLERVMDDPRS